MIELVLTLPMDYTYYITGRVCTHADSEKCYTPCCNIFHETIPLIGKKEKKQMQTLNVFQDLLVNNIGYHSEDIEMIWISCVHSPCASRSYSPWHHKHHMSAQCPKQWLSLNN